MATLSRASNGPIVASFAKHPVQEPDVWPATKPPFVELGLHRVLYFDPSGRLWIERASAVGAPKQYDVIGRDAKLVLQVTLPARTVLAGFGSDAIYAVQVDQDDTQHLQRFRFPPMNNR